MTKTHSLRRRFILATVVATSVGLLLTGLLIDHLMRSYIEQGFHEEMEVHIEELAALTAVDKRGQPYLQRRLSDPRFMARHSGFYWQVERKGFATLRSPSLAQDSLSGSLAKREAPRWKILSGPTGEMLEYGMTRQIPAGEPLKLSIATDVSLIEETATEFDTPLIYALSALAVVMATLAAVQIFYSLRPLDTMKRAIAAIRSGTTQHLDGAYPSEIAPLISDLNQLLDANGQMIKSARIQAGNLAHGLRTPLAIMLDEAQELAQQGNTESAETLMTECQKILRYIDYYTAQARSAALARMPGQNMSLVGALVPIISAMERLHKGRKLSINIDDLPDMILSCDAVDLEEIISNIVDNACKWARHKVLISWAQDENHVQIYVDDDGPSIPPAQYDHVFAIGERLDSMTPGTGLGLAIVRDLVALYQGTVELSKSHLGGLRVSVSLPKVSS